MLPTCNDAVGNLGDLNPVDKTLLLRLSVVDICALLVFLTRISCSSDDDSSRVIQQSLQLPSLYKDRLCSNWYLF